MSRYKTFGDTKEHFTEGLKSFIKKNYTSYPTHTQQRNTYSEQQSANVYQNAKDIAYGLVNQRKNEYSELGNSNIESYRNEQAPYRDTQVPYTNNQMPYNNQATPFVNYQSSVNEHHFHPEVSYDQRTPIDNLMAQQEYPSSYYQPVYQPVHQQQDMRYTPRHIGCEDLIIHIDNCKKCRRKYRSNYNSYLTVVVIMAFIILFLLTKIVDK